MLASFLGNVDIVEVLLKHNADVNARTKVIAAYNVMHILYAELLCMYKANAYK